MRLLQRPSAWHRLATVGTATTVRVIDHQRQQDFEDVLDKLRHALKARFDTDAVQIGRDEAPAPVPVIVHGVGDASVEKAIREELGVLDPHWTTWLAVAR